MFDESPVSFFLDDITTVNITERLCTMMAQFIESIPETEPEPEPGLGSPGASELLGLEGHPPWMRSGSGPPR